MLLACVRSLTVRRHAMTRLCIFVGALAVSGCAYQTLIYAPEPIRAEDHVQRSEIFIYRDSLNVQLNVSRNKKALQLSMLFASVDPSARFVSMDFALEANGEVFRPTAPPEVYSPRTHSTSRAPLTIVENEWLEVEFAQGTDDFSSCRLRIPAITIRGETVRDLDALIVTKKKAWRAISPL